jgi:hypothetical protein
VAGLIPATVRLQARSVQGGANPLQVSLLRPVANRNCVAARRGGEQRKANRVVRSETKLDSATLTGEPAVEGRSLYPCKRESHDAEGLGVKAIIGVGASVLVSPVQFICIRQHGLSQPRPQIYSLS